MKSLITIGFLLFSVIFLSYKDREKTDTTDYYLSGEISLQLGNVDTLVKAENSQSKDISLLHFVGVSDGNDFDTDSFDLELPITLQKSSTETIDVETSYYFTKRRETVLKLYEWNIKDPFKSNPLLSGLFEAGDDKRKQEVKSHFKKKFQMLETFINSEMGMPEKRLLESEMKADTEETLRDDVYWKNDQIRVHLYRFSDANGRFNQIRTLVYEIKLLPTSAL